MLKIILFFSEIFFHFHFHFDRMALSVWWNPFIFVTTLFISLNNFFPSWYASTNYFDRPQLCPPSIFNLLACIDQVFCFCFISFHNNVLPYPLSLHLLYIHLILNKFLWTQMIRIIHSIPGKISLFLCTVSLVLLYFYW